MTFCNCPVGFLSFYAQYVKFCSILTSKTVIEKLKWKQGVDGSIFILYLHVTGHASTDDGSSSDRDRGEDGQRLDSPNLAVTYPITIGPDLDTNEINFVSAPRSGGDGDDALSGDRSGREPVNLILPVHPTWTRLEYTSRELLSGVRWGRAIVIYMVRGLMITDSLSRSHCR